MIDCFAFLFASSNLEEFFFFHPFFFPKTGYFFPLHFFVLVLFQARNLGLIGTEISPTSALKLI